MYKHFFIALRPKHWIKNLFIFLPLIFGKKLFVYPTVLRSIAAFCLFFLAASGSYLINDIIDSERDRLHPTKRSRPIASGKLNVRQGLIVALLLQVFAILVSFIFSVPFGCIIAAYILFNFIYSKVLKDVVIVDVFCIAGFFILRIMAGSVAGNMAMSYWIIVMTVLLALFLGFNKRRQELNLYGEAAFGYRAVLKKYSRNFIDRMIMIVTSLILLAYILYTIDGRTVRELGTCNLVFTIPFVYYGIFRYLYLIHKVQKDGDPVQMLLGDRMMRVDLALWISACIWVIYFGSQKGWPN